MASTDPETNIQSFLDPNFDPVDYFNSALPSLASPANLGRGAPTGVTLSELNNGTQALLSQLNAHLTRQLDALAQHTDDILRSGSRLAYEVEVLRGDTATLVEDTKEELNSDIEVFLPNGISNLAVDDIDHTQSSKEVPNQTQPPLLSAGTPALGPPAISQLRTLSLVRNRLELVIRVFGDAMDWPLPPSEVSVASSFISVSAPEPGSDNYSREEKGQEVLKNLKKEVMSLLNDSSKSATENIAAATSRVSDLGALTKVWAGTAEEKPRSRFVDSLAKLVEDKQKQMDKEQLQLQKRGERQATASPRKSISSVRPQTPDTLNRESGVGGYGFINQLQKMRGGL